jgi:HD-like signal output (HDOD) protein
MTSEVKSGAADVAACGERMQERLSAGSISFPPLPAVASEVLRLAASPDADARRLTELLHRDPALAAQVVRVANSPLHAPREPIVSLQQAVARMGLGAVQDLAFAAAAKSAAFAAPSHAALAEAEWRHALVAAGFAREIGRQRRRAVESAFLAGLLHDAGRLVAYREIAACEGAPLSSAFASAVADLVHVDLGGELVRAWRLPAPIGEAVAFHHDLASAPEGSEVAPTTALADEMAHAAIDDVQVEAGRFVGTAAAVRLGLYPDDVAAVWDKKEAILATAALSS